MQIRNDFNNFSGREYHDSHTHHITKCLHEEAHKKHEAAAFGMRKDFAGGDADAGEKAQQDVVLTHGIGTARQNHSSKKALGVLKGIWDSMGEEELQGQREKQTPSSGQKSFFHNPIAAAVSAFGSVVSDRIADKWAGVGEKIKVNIKSALKRFGRNRDTFTALSDPKGHSTENRDAQEQYDSKPGNGTRRKTPDLRTAVMADTHLMDSYSKTGEYCRLNENLTYQKNKMAEGSEKLDKPL